MISQNWQNINFNDLQIKIPIYGVDVFLFNADVAEGDLG